MRNWFFYYTAKPFIPWRIRMMVRRTVASIQRRRHQADWPISPTAAQPPKNWPGWPDGKKFALVLTHDVESKIGLERCRDLMRLEMEKGFRSSFAFIPEGPYETPPQLREELVQNGFEVAVHDLHHDGKLFWNRERFFTTDAPKINRYLKEWGACGFRGGMMMRNLDWIHQLDIQYDASTFDTDPFEPMPDGLNTIFPRWIPGGKGGYVELPYTLPQDSTLFLVLREKTIDIWKKKLDWLAEHGGMALINTHPDYMGFQSNGHGLFEYDVQMYSKFLDYICLRYFKLGWFVLPNRVAAYFKMVTG